jgi:hypothetical protein
MRTTSYKGSDLSQGFKSYSRKVCKLIAAQLSKVNGQITDFNIGFYYFSGFFTVKGKIFYFCSYKAARERRKVAIRLNGTSDIDFVKLIQSKLKTNILELPGLFYDYTAIPNKEVKNYVITRYFGIKGNPL